MKQRLIYIIGVALLLLSPVRSSAQISYQYWIDDNKDGAVSGTTTDGAAISLNIDAAGLTTGVHFLNMRAGEGKKWGTLHRQLFCIPRDANAATSGMKGYEYWIDSDYEHRVTATVTNSTEESAVLTVDAGSLSTGVHFFNMRVQDANGQWGAVRRQLFCIPREQQASSAANIAGYRYGFGDELTTVTLASPVSKHQVVGSYDVPVPLPTIIDDDCHFSFDDSEATLLRNIDMTFTLLFFDETNAISSPVGTTFTVTDIQTSDIQTLSVPGSLTIPEHATGGYTVMKFDIATATTYVLTSTSACSLRLYSSEGAYIKTVASELLAKGSLQDLEVGSYYAVAYGNDAETKLSIAQETPIVHTVATPTITHEGNVVTITTTTPDASIYYTLDGTIPTAESLLYTEPFTVTENCTIFAFAKRDGYEDSEYASLDVDWIVVGTPCGYAIYDSATTTLTFKYGIMPEGDNVWETDDTGTTTPLWPRNITTVVFDATYAQARPTSTYFWFSGSNKLTQIKGIEYLNTSKVTNMQYMFYNCSGLTSLNVSNFNTANVTNMQYMFYNCSKLTSLDVSNFSTANVTNMSCMFYNCSSLTSLNVSNFNTASVTSMGSMFNNCSGLTSLNVSNFNTENVTSMYNMFYGCSGLTSLNVSNFNTEKVTDMSWMFSNCTGLTSLNVSNFNTEKATRMDYMFCNCCKLTSLDLSKFNTSNVTNMSAMFTLCYGLKSLNISSFDTSKVHNMGGMFNSCNELTSIDVSHFNTSNVTVMSAMFSFCSNLTSLDVSNFDTRQVINMWGMFQDCHSLTSLDLSNFRTDNVTSMQSMFNYCTGLKTLDISHFNTEKVTNMACMFELCKSLTSLDLTHFNTSNVTDMNRMFNLCSGLTSLQIGSFDTRKVTDMKLMFAKTNSLPKLDLGNFDTNSVTAMDSLFCSTGNDHVVYTWSSFYGYRMPSHSWTVISGSKLTTIYASDTWSTASVTEDDYLFVGCTALKGGNGTTYNASNVKKSYARIDNGTSSPGYLTGIVRGDTNGDTHVTISDAVGVVDYILGNPSESSIYSAADVNRDYKITISDAVGIVDIILSGSAPAPPLRPLQTPRMTETETDAAAEENNAIQVQSVVIEEHGTMPVVTSRAAAIAIPSETTAQEDAE